MKFNEAAAVSWSRAYAHYLRGWLPASYDARVADIACGGGKLLFFFLRHGYRRTEGVDISPEQVSLARQIIDKVVVGDATEFLEARPSQFDLLIALDVIEHLRKDEVMRFLDACSKALRPGGRLIIQTPNAESPWGLSLRYADFTHEVAFGPDVLHHLFSMAGLSKIEARELEPVPVGYSLLSTIRYCLWCCVRTGIKIRNLIEAGSPGSGIFTRVFLISGIKNDELPLKNC